MSKCYLKTLCQDHGRIGYFKVAVVAMITKLQHTRSYLSKVHWHNCMLILYFYHKMAGREGNKVCEVANAN